MAKDIGVHYNYNLNANLVWTHKYQIFNANLFLTLLILFQIFTVASNTDQIFAQLRIPNVVVTQADIWALYPTVQSDFLNVLVVFFLHLKKLATKLTIFYLFSPKESLLKK